MKQIELSVLMTQDDYAAFLVQKRRMQRGRRFQTALYVGELLVVAAAAGLFFGDRIGMSAASAVCLLAAGIALIAYDYVIAPWLDRLTAVRDYAEKENLRPACLYLRGGRTEGTLPFAFLTEWMQTPDYFTLSFGRETAMFIPKRLLSQEECSQLENWLRASNKGMHKKGRQ